MHKSKKDIIDEALKEELKEESTEEKDSEEKSEEEKLKDEIASLKDQYLRKLAEFENYKRRTENDLMNFFKYANEGLIKELIPVLDDFDRVEKSFEESHDLEALKKGFEIVDEKFRKAMEKQGVKEIPEQKKFDVHFHEAIMQTPKDDVEPDTILETSEKGYMYKDKIIRHAKVVVSAKPERGENGKA